MAGSVRGSARTTPRVRAERPAAKAASTLAQRHGLSRLPRTSDKASLQGRFAQAVIGCVRIAAAEPTDLRDISKRRLAGNKPSMVLAIGRASRFTERPGSAATPGR